MEDIINDVFAHLFDIDKKFKDFITHTDHTINVDLLKLMEYANDQNVMVELMEGISQIRTFKKVYNAIIVVTIGH